MTRQCCRFVVMLLCGWSCFCVGYCGKRKKDSFVVRRNSMDKQRSPKTAERLLPHDAVTDHMHVLYARYNQAEYPVKDGNTVRSFKAQWGAIYTKQMLIFNLTTLAKSEDVLSAILHFSFGDANNKSHVCYTSKSGDNHTPKSNGHIQIIIWSFVSASNKMRTLGHILVNVSILYKDSIAWQWKDITNVVNHGKNLGGLFIGIDIQSHFPLKGLLLDHSSYILVYANDSAISEPESVVTTLQRHRLPGVEAVIATSPHEFRKQEYNATEQAQLELRHKRSTNILLPLRNNELPGPEYPYRTSRWAEANPYEPFQKKRSSQPLKKLRKNQRQKMAALQFDQKTIKKAEKKQWNESRNCARRYLKVDFADIGWSEWIISPKSFDAYYCSGSCPFPMPKALKPSNHATIQSIVRAVGVVQGIPEPCCVPEKMSSLSVLFFDEDRNVVLKVYPNMTVDSCACR